MIGRIPDEDYRRSFNLGIGMIFAVSRKNAAEAEKILKKAGENPYTIGNVVAANGSERVIYR